MLNKKPLKKRTYRERLQGYADEERQATYIPSLEEAVSSAKQFSAAMKEKARMTLAHQSKSSFQ
jgi:hypothetical protein